jgi:malate permease and related proteins
VSNIILLLFCFVAGMALRRTRRMPDNASAALNGFIINIGLPALALAYLHGMALDGILLVAALMPWIMFILAIMLIWPVARLLGLSRSTTGCVILVGGLANTSFVGVPMIEAFYGPEYMGIGIVADLLGSQIVLAVFGIALARAFSDGPRPKVAEIVWRVLQFPPFVATVAALALTGVSFPEWLEELLLRLASTVAPIALLSVGFQLRLSDVRGKVPALALGLLYKLLIGPALIYAIYVGLLDLLGPVVRISIFEAAMAPMVSAAIIAMDNDLDPPLATLLVGVGVPISFLTLIAWYHFLGGV